MSKLLKSYTQNIQGVKEIKSYEKGPVVTISACTHGGELAGEKTIEYLIEKLNIEKELIKGKIYFILTNIKGYEKSFHVENPVDARFINENLNRCCSIENLQNSTAYEVNRALELEPILKITDVHFDIHSTYIPSESMLINTSKGEERFKGIFNCDAVYSGITEVQVGKPFIDITERHGGYGIGIECGDENDENVYKVGVENSIRLLSEMGMVDINHFQEELTILKDNIPNEIYGTIIVPNCDFKPVRDFQHGDFVKAGEIIAEAGKHIITAPKNSLILIPNPGLIVGEEYCFLANVI